MCDARKSKPIKTSFNWVISNLSRLTRKQKILSSCVFPNSFHQRAYCKKSNFTSVTNWFKKSESNYIFLFTLKRGVKTLNRSFATIMSLEEIQKKLSATSCKKFVIKSHDNDYIHTFSTMSSIKSSSHSHNFLFQNKLE